MIYYLVYLSSANHLYSDAELSQILSVSRLNNSSKDVTGILLYHQGSIIQVLEGDKEIVTNLYLKIKEDERHKNVLRMVDGMCAERNFPDWSMAFKTVTDSEWNEYSGYMGLNSSALLSILKKTNLRIDTMIKSFATTNNISR
ncbi:MAG: BLUF domain-containing protein [Parafilimonas sp.]